MKKTIKSIIKKAVPNKLITRRLNQSDTRSLLLTFDDGPHEHITPQVLSILDDFDVKAIFFVVGRFVRKHPELLLEIKKRGHIVGNHTYHHPNCRISTYSEYIKEVTECQKIIKEITGEEPIYFRPPMGFFSIYGLIAARKLKMKTILWSYSGGEWADYEKYEAKFIADRAISAVGSGEIILFHDNNPKIIEVLNTLLPAVVKQDFDLSNGITFLP